MDDAKNARALATSFPTFQILASELLRSERRRPRRIVSVADPRGRRTRAPSPPPRRSPVLLGVRGGLSFVRTRRARRKYHLRSARGGRALARGDARRGRRATTSDEAARVSLLFVRRVRTPRRRRRRPRPVSGVRDGPGRDRRGRGGLPEVLRARWTSARVVGEIRGRSRAVSAFNVRAGGARDARARRRAQEVRFVFAHRGRRVRVRVVAAQLRLARGAATRARCVRGVRVARGRVRFRAAKKTRARFAESAETFEADGPETARLAETALGSLARRSTKKLTETHVSLSLADIASIAELEKGEAEAERVVLEMIDKGEMTARIDAAARSVTFLDAADDPFAAEGGSRRARRRGRRGARARRARAPQGRRTARVQGVRRRDRGPRRAGPAGGREGEAG